MNEYMEQDMREQPENYTWKEVVLFVIVMAVVVWAVCTVLHWFGDVLLGYERTLVETIMSQGEFISKLRIW